MKKHAAVRALCALLLAMGFAVLAAAPALGQTGEPYSYKIRVFQGNRGEIRDNTGEGYAEYEVAAGDSFTLPDPQRDTDYITITDDRYYAKGYRLSGKDYGTDNRVERLSFAQVNEDMDFVVAYGVKTDMVSYTVTFVEYETGRVLGTAGPFYGNEGDKPVFAYEFIEGYRPRYLNLTGTLGPEGTNNWTLEYIPLEENVTTTVTVTEVEAPTTTEPETVTTTTEGTGTTAESELITTPGTEGAAGTTAGTEGTTGTAAGAGTEEAPATEEMLDMDNPLASPTTPGSGGKLNGTNAGNAGGIGRMVPVMLGALFVALLILLFFLLFVRRKKREDEQIK